MIPRRNLRPLVVLVAASLLGCVGTDADITSNSLAIVGGELSTGDPAVAALLTTYPGGGQSLCTGTLIAPDVILTAAHCLNGQEPESRLAFFGADLRQGTGDPSFIEAIEIVDSVYDIGFDISNLAAGHDIGLVRLATASTVAPIPLNTTSLTGLVGQEIRLAGFGRTVGQDAGGSGGSGVKRTTDSTIRTFIDAFGGNVNPPDLVAYGSTVENTCNGDSGGPNFVTIGGVEYVAGITSFGDRNCEVSGAGTRVDRYIDFISAYVAGEEPTCVDDGICEESCATPDPDCAVDQCATDGECVELCGAQDADCPATTGIGAEDDGSASGGSAGATGDDEEENAPEYSGGTQNVLSGCSATGDETSTLRLILAVALLAVRRKQRREGSAA